MFPMFDPMYFLFLAPAILLMLWAQWRVKSAFSAGMQVPANLSGAAAAQHILESAGLHDVGVEMTQGMLTDHYDPRDRVLRLSPQVYQSRTAAAVGIAAHEAGHALQHATGYMPLAIRNAAVPAAQVGPTVFFVLLIIGAMISRVNGSLGMGLIGLGIAAYGAVLVFQLINLPVEFDASNRAKHILSEYQIVDEQGAVAVRDVLNAAGWTYVAATLQMLLTILYWVYTIFGRSRN